MVSSSVSSKKPVPLVDLGRQYRQLKKELAPVIQEVLASGHFVHGPHHQAFAGEFARYCNASHCVPVANGTDALILALKALRIGPGDEVLLPALTFIATAGAVCNAGAIPVFADVEEKTMCLDPESVKNKISPKTKAIIAVHLYGHPANMTALNTLASGRSLPVIEDAAQAHGAKHNGRRVGSLGTMACFSFYPSKNLGAYGDGGAVVTQDEALAKRLTCLSSHGSEGGRYNYVEIGTNSRLDELQAAILRVKLRYLDAENEARRKIASRYQKLLEGTGDLILPQASQGSEHVYHVYVIRSKKRDALCEWLRNDGILAQVHYPSALHLTTPFQKLSIPPGALPAAEKIGTEVLSLPMFSGLKESEIRRVVRSVKNFFKKD